jgi:hypothetical protein
VREEHVRVIRDGVPREGAQLPAGRRQIAGERAGSGRKGMKLAYVAGPYRASTESGVVQNIRNAEAVAVELWKKGYAVICPHKNTALFGGLAPDEVWLKGDLVMMERCDLVVLVPGWHTSSGTRAEVARAKELGIPMYEAGWDQPEGFAIVREGLQ